jgi:hypothetical protein
MKATVITLACINSSPLIIYLFVWLPSLKIIQSAGDYGEAAMEQFFVLGFAWATLLYPLVLLFNHFFCFLNFRRKQVKAALGNQLTMSLYIIVLVIYGAVTMLYIN